jgi:chromosome partitioning protein
VKSIRRSLAITNQKGGVGKTTTAINFAAALSQMDWNVLLIDLDPQGNATSGSGLEDYSYSSAELIIGKCEAQSCIYPSAFGGFDLIPASEQLIESEIALLQQNDRFSALKKAVNELISKYHVILFDCPPSLNILSMNALMAADAVLIPVQCEYYALEGLTHLLKTLNSLRQTHQLEIDGIIRTMYDGRLKLSKEVSSQLKSNFDQWVFDTMIPRNVKLAEAPSHNKPIQCYDPKSQGAMAYLALAYEWEKRVTNQRAA